MVVTTDMPAGMAADVTNVSVTHVCVPCSTVMRFC
jgi:hypothetical protein